MVLLGLFPWVNTANAWDKPEEAGKHGLIMLQEERTVGEYAAMDEILAAYLQTRPELLADGSQQSGSAIDFLAGKNILRGKISADGQLKVAEKDLVTRAEFVVFIVRSNILAEEFKNHFQYIGLEKLTDSIEDKALEAKTQGKPSRFTDIQGSWAEKYIEYAEQEGLLRNSIGDTFRPDQPITFEEMTYILSQAATMISPGANQEKPDLTKYVSDLKVGDKPKDTFDRSTAISITKDYYEILSTILKLQTAGKLDEGITAIKAASLKKFDVPRLNALLATVEETSFQDTEKASLKREIIRESGFTNFDWKGTLSDVYSFTNMEIRFVEFAKPSKLFRRGYPAEPSSKYGLGYWWADKSRTIETARDELAILQNWGNPLTSEYIIIAPVGTRALTGTAAPQTYRNPAGEVIETRKGGGVQYFLNNIDNAWLEKEEG